MKDVVGFEGLYALTEDGQVWNYLTEDFQTLFDNGQGYYYVPLTKNFTTKNYRVNVLMAKTYLGKPPADGKRYVADHIDDNRKNNHYTNLQWLSYSDNALKRKNKHQSKPRRPVRCIETGEVFESQAEAGRAIGKHKYGINNVLMGRQKTCGGYHWEYADE